MAIVAMTDAVAGQVASSAEYNKLIDNIQDLDARLGNVLASNTASARLTALETITASGTSGNSALNTRLATVESLTTDTATNGGQGNVRLADRLGTGVGTGSNVTTGSASSQLADLRSRATTLEGTVNAAGTGNAALGTRVTALESASGTAPIVRATRLSAAAVNLANNGYTFVPWTAAPRNPNTMWSNANQTRLTVPAGQGGLYAVNAMVLLLPNNATGAAGGKISGIRVNGAGSIIRAGGPYAGSSGTYTEVIFASHVELNAGDYIELGIWTNGLSAGTDLQIASDAANPWVVMRKVA